MVLGAAKPTGQANRQANGVWPEWRLVKGADRHFLSSGFGYAHFVTVLGEHLIGFGGHSSGVRPIVVRS